MRLKTITYPITYPFRFVDAFIEGLSHYLTRLFFYEEDSKSTLDIVCEKPNLRKILNKEFEKIK